MSYEFSDRKLQLKEMSEYLGIEIKPELNDVIDLNRIIKLTELTNGINQSEISKKEKSLSEILNSELVHELSETKIEKSISKQAHLLFLDFDVNDRIELLLKLSELHEIINNRLTNIDAESLIKINECIENIMKSKIISNTQIRV